MRSRMASRCKVICAEQNLVNIIWVESETLDRLLSLSNIPSNRRQNKTNKQTKNVQLFLCLMYSRYG